MNGWQWFGDAFGPCGSVPIEDRGFRYGMSVFETVALIDGQPRFLAEHLDRLAAAAAHCGFAFPRSASDATAPLLAAIPFDGVARLYVTADNRVFVLAEPRPPRLPDAYSLSTQTTVHLPYPAGLKTGNYWRNLATVEAARAQGHDEALLVAPDGLVISACMANVFAAHAGALSTPATSSGARDGVVRSWVMAHSPATERNLTLADLDDAEEIFLTNSWIGVMPVARFRTPLPAPGPLARDLMDRYRERFSDPSRAPAQSGRATPARSASEDAPPDRTATRSEAR